MFAQMFPGMELIPVAILSVGVGLTAGAIGALAAAVDARSMVARWAAGVACLLGLGMFLLLLVVVGTQVDAVAYLVVSSPSLIGLVTLGFTLLARRQPSVEAHLLRASSKRSACVRCLSTALLCLLATAACVPVAFMVYWHLLQPLGNVDPSGRISPGMSGEDVTAVLGAPHSQCTDADGMKTWIYYLDWTRLSYFAIDFDREDRVERCWQD